MLSVKSVEKRYDPGPARRILAGGTAAYTARPALCGVSLAVDSGQFHTLLGPSGCGKTTLLRSVAGLEEPDAGDIELAGEPLFSSGRHVNLSPDRRRLGMVFQSYAIWPHMSVRDNVAFPLKAGRQRQKRTRAEIDRRVRSALGSVGLCDVIDRSATRLSGGQQQRLAFARALVGDPRLLLLDEPLSNLDAQLRASMRLELKRLQRELGLTTLYVTHDQAEALAMSDVITVMNGGRVMQQGSPREIYDRPANLFVARFVGSPNVIPARIDDPGRRSVASEIGRLRLGEPVAPGLDDLAVVLRPEDLVPRPLTGEEPEAGENDLVGTVVEQSFEGECVRHIVQVAGRRLECRSTRHHDVRQGDDVVVRVEPGNARVVPAEA
ncbi:ABC transporter ATP-binding protein [Streptomyces sp. NPDC047002]|uniref:ABC transporter ATP-binding protein n=1 Tax=Streptomyces sp. NPDC047002 TaxID=3155475 RepID=UPI003453C2C5